MLLSALLATLAACAHGAVLPSPDGRIVGGVPASISEIPYQVTLLKGSPGAFYTAHCGGSIISSSVVLTAGHCIVRSRPENWKVRAGSSAHNYGGQVVRVARLVQHPGYVSVENDVALLHLTKPLVLGPCVAVVPLPPQGAPVPTGASALASGWGSMGKGHDYPLLLRKVTIPVVDQKVCAAAYMTFHNITDKMLCAGTNGKDACQGDSGGPLVVDGVLVGVTSWGKGCGLPGYPGVWARVPSYRNWIDANM